MDLFGIYVRFKPNFQCKQYKHIKLFLRFILWYVKKNRININAISAYNSISWNGLSQTVHLVSPSSSSSLSSSTVPLCCEAANDEWNAGYKSIRVFTLSSVSANVCVYASGHSSINYNPLRTMIRDPSRCGRITWSRTAREEGHRSVAWQVDTLVNYSWIIKSKRQYRFDLQNEEPSRRSYGIRDDLTNFVEPTGIIFDELVCAALNIADFKSHYNIRVIISPF